MTTLYRHPTGGDPRLLIGRCVVKRSRSTSSAERGSDVSGRPRARQLAATPVARYTVLVFLLAAAMIVAVAVTLDRNARHSSWQEHTTALAGGARVGASSFESLRANLRVQATQLATSLPLQRAVVTGNEAELRQDRRRPARADRPARPLDRGARRDAAHLVVGKDHRRPPRARDRHDRPAARRRGADAPPAGDAAAHAWRSGARARRPGDRWRPEGGAGGHPRRSRRPPRDGIRRSGRAASGRRHLARRGRARLGDRRALGALPALRLPRGRPHARPRRRAREQARQAAGPGDRRRRPPDPAGAHRRSDGPRQPPRAHPPARGRAPARRAQRDEPLVRDRRHRRLQADQRRLRASAGRRRDQGGRVRARRARCARPTWPSASAARSS